MSKRRSHDYRNAPIIDLTGEVDNFHPAFKRPRTSQFAAMHYAGTSYLAEQAQASSYSVHPSYYRSGAVEVYDNAGACRYSYPNSSASLVNRVQFLPSSHPNARHSTVFAPPQPHNVSGHDLVFGNDGMPLNIVRPYQRTAVPNATRGTPIPVQISCRGRRDLRTGSNTSVPVQDSGIGISPYIPGQFHGPVVSYNPYEAVSWQENVRADVIEGQVSQQQYQRVVPRFSGRRMQGQHSCSYQDLPPVNLPAHQITSFPMHHSHGDLASLGQHFTAGANPYHPITLPSPPKIRRVPSHFQALPEFLDIMCSIADHESRRRVFPQVVDNTNRNVMELRGMVAF